MEKCSDIKYKELQICFWGLIMHSVKNFEDKNVVPDGKKNNYKLTHGSDNLNICLLASEACIYTAVITKLFWHSVTWLH